MTEEQQPETPNPQRRIVGYALMVFNLMRTAWTEYERDNGRYLSAAMIYYTLISLVPLLLLLLSALGMLLRFSDIAISLQEQLLRSIEIGFGPQLRETVEQLFATLQQESIIVSVISVVGLILTSSVLFRHLRMCFRAIWKYTPTLVSGTMRVVVRATFLEQVMALALVLTGGGLLLLSFVLIAATQWLNNLLNELPVFSRTAAWLLAIISPLTIVTITFAFLFRYLPPLRIRWRIVWPVALLCAAAVSITGELLTLYGIFFDSNPTATGAIGALFVALLWLNIISQVLFFGGELCKVLTQQPELLQIETVEDSQPSSL